jgi:mitochondrial fission protein ELM1
MKMNVWVLVDNKVGSSKQAIALAEILGYGHEIKKVTYTAWAKLPNFFPLLDRFILDKSSRKALSKGMPDIVIGSGRRLARVMGSLKIKYPKCKFIQILKPGRSIQDFDALILPHHDTIKLAPKDKKKKIIRVSGAIVNYNLVEDAKAVEKWSPLFEHLPKPRIALLIGGSAKGCKMERKHALELANKSIELAERLKGSLLVTNSRRTDKEVSRIIFQEIKDSGVSHTIYDSNGVLDNPYAGYLAIADYIIVTGDSISMCIESVHTNKPVIIYCPKAMVSRKHWRFVEQLVTDGQANLLKNFDVKSMVVPKNKSDDLKREIQLALNISET